MRVLRETAIVLAGGLVLGGGAIAVGTPVPLYVGLAACWLFMGWTFGGFVAGGGVAPGWEPWDEPPTRSIRRGGLIGLAVAATLLTILLLFAALTPGQ